MIPLLYCYVSACSGTGDRSVLIANTILAVEHSYDTKQYCVVQDANHSPWVLTLLCGSGGLHAEKAAPQAGTASQRLGFMPMASSSAEAAAQAGTSEHLCLGVNPSCYPIAGLMSVANHSTSGLRSGTAFQGRAMHYTAQLQCAGYS